MNKGWRFLKYISVCKDSDAPYTPYMSTPYTGQTLASPTHIHQQQTFSVTQCTSWHACDQEAPCIYLITFGITTVCSGYFLD